MCSWVWYCYSSLPAKDMIVLYNGWCILALMYTEDRFWYYLLVSIFYCCMKQFLMWIHSLYELIWSQQRIDRGDFATFLIIAWVWNLTLIFYRKLEMKQGIGRVMISPIICMFITTNLFRTHKLSVYIVNQV